MILRQQTSTLRAPACGMYTVSYVHGIKAGLSHALMSSQLWTATRIKGGSALVTAIRTSCKTLLMRVVDDPPMQSKPSLGFAWNFCS